MLASQRYYFAVLAVFLVLVSCSFLLFHADEFGRFGKVDEIPHRFSKPTLEETIISLFGAIKHDPSSPGYIDPSGQYYKGGDKPTWTRPLGKRVLIVDIDTRVPTKENQIFNPGVLDWEHLDMKGGGLVSNAILNHYLYALIHGYDYMFYQAEHIVDHHDSWIMPHVLRELVPSYQFVVAMDADVVVPHLEVPLEWMFNRWGIQSHTSMALPWDTEEFRNNVSISTDSKRLLVLNTGFVVAQNSPLTQELLEAWRDCTSETRYSDCGQWKHMWSHEQRAFSEYIRYDFNKTPETIVPIPCNDAVGWPGFKERFESTSPGISDCKGNFIQHHTIRKEYVKEGASNSVMQVIGQALQQNLLRQQETLWYKESEHKTVDETPEVVDLGENRADAIEASISPVVTENLITDILSKRR